MFERPPPRATTGLKRWVLRACLLAVVAPWAVQSGCNRQPAPPTASPGRSAQTEPIEVRVKPVQTLPVERFLELTGTLFGQEEVTVAAKVPGRIVEVNADLGDAVAHGGRLAQVETIDYGLAVGEARSAWLAALAKLGLRELPEGEINLSSLPVVARAEAQAANSLARLERARKLYERSPPLISDQEFADIQTQSEVARTDLRGEEINAQAQLADARVRQAALALAEKRLADASVIAPAELTMQYRVAVRMVSVGEYVSAGTPLFRLVAVERVKFRGSVPERFAGQIIVGAPAFLQSEAYPQPFEARVVRISPAVDPTSRAFEIEIEADNTDGRLKPGGFLRARVRTHTEENAKFVPTSAVSQFAGVQRLFTVRDGKVIELKVRTGETRGELIEAFELPPTVEFVIDQPRRGLAQGMPAGISQTDEPPAGARNPGTSTR